MTDQQQLMIDDRGLTAELLPRGSRARYYRPHQTRTRQRRRRASVRPASSCAAVVGVCASVRPPGAPQGFTFRLNGPDAPQFRFDHACDRVAVLRCVVDTLESVEDMMGVLDAGRTPLLTARDVFKLRCASGGLDQVLAV